MRKRDKTSLQKQIKDKFDGMLRIGISKHDDKQAGLNTQKYIYSWESYRSYLKHALYFAQWVKEQPIDVTLGHKPRTLEEARPFVEKWLQSNIDRGLSAYTIKLQAATMGKLYGCHIQAFDIKTPARSRADITRSRGEKVRDKNFNESKHEDLVTFCRCTGVRRAELEQIRGTDLRMIDGKYYLDITRATKGGRPRTSPVMASDEEMKIILELTQKAGSGKIFDYISTHADIHGYRSQYATRVYEANKRPVSDFKGERLIVFRNRVIEAYNANIHYKPDRISFSKYYDKTKSDQYGQPKMLPGYKDVSSVYFCKRDLAGTIYDRRALFAASNALGHNRESVVAEHYIRA